MPLVIIHKVALEWNLKKLLNEIKSHLVTYLVIIVQLLNTSLLKTISDKFTIFMYLYLLVSY